MITTMLILTTLAIVLLECAFASTSNDICNTMQTSYSTINTLLQKDLQDMPLESSLRLNLDSTRGTNGKVLSAVFEPVSSTGFLNRSMISVARGASFSVSYNIAIQNGIDNTKLNRAELWVYPETQENATLVDLYVQIRAETPNVSRLVTRRPGHTWMTQDRCIPLDVTLAVKKLFRALHKREQSSALVKITVSITNVLTRTDPLLRERDNRCQALTTGCNQKQFLVLKYSKPKSTGNGELTPGITEPLVSTPPPATSDRNTNSNTTTTAPSSLPTTSKQPCIVEDYYINLNSSAFIPVSPNRLNIKHCSGMCSATDIRKFTAHGQLKKEFSDLSSCCVPTELSDTTIVINQNGVMMSILLSDAIVKQCSCR